MRDRRVFTIQYYLILVWIHWDGIVLGMEATPNNRISALIGATAQALGGNLILDKVADLICGELDRLSTGADLSESESVAAVQSPTDSATEPVDGLPAGLTWTAAASEQPVKKVAALAVRHASKGVVLRNESGTLHYAHHDIATNQLRVPSGFRTSRSKAIEYEIPRNGAYRWRLVGFVEGPST